MDRDSFQEAVRDALFSIHDFVALEKSPLGKLIPRAEPALRPVEGVKRFLLDGIEQLKPGTPSGDTLEWRYYRILAGRYQEGLSMGELEHRLALELIFYQGLSLQEAAEVCGCPVGTVKSRLNYAKASLRGALSRAGLMAEDVEG